MNKIELLQKHERSIDKVIQLLKSAQPIDFTRSVDGRWNLHQQAEHLILSVRPFDLVFSMPKFALKALYKRDKNISYSYEELVKLYTDKIQQGGRASSEYVPADRIPEELLLQSFEESHKKYITGMNGFTEEELDRIILPHPLIGKISLREMLYFSSYHIEFHYMRMQEIMMHQ